MQSMQRQFGRMTTKRSADDSQVAVLLKDIKDADQLLTQIIDSTKAWRDAWTSVATHQSRLAEEFDGLYAPIVGSSTAPTAHRPVDTDPMLLRRTNKLRRDFDDLRIELSQELRDVEARMTNPAEQAKQFLSPIWKTIKKREERKLDFERYQNKVDGYMKKTKRTDRDNMALAKAETELAQGKANYQAADEDLIRRLPKLIALTFSLIPIILNAQIEIQNRLLGQYYTALHAYCEGERFPSPPPPMDQIIMDWEDAHFPIRNRFESFDCLAQGKSIRQTSADQPEEKSSRFNILGKSRSNGNIPQIPFTRKPSHPAPSFHGSLSPSQPEDMPPSLPNNKPPPQRYPSPSPPASLMTRPSTLSINSSAATSPPASDYQPATPQPGSIQYAPAGPKMDYFSRERNAAPSPAQTDYTSVIAKKKKPPPPPRALPQKFVRALYDFDGQGPGDLSFRENDCIRIVQRTASTDDWWEGELAGVKGSFPANYVETI
ncbi:hypothetical protein N7510_003166 [Penicillium lagena]|uniref:uncharacterized protein n=1 Tax=Penicillium lagena TaxID=94218 RepID=UPI002540CB86|nr:uncharacterized protein N7510_003166 [Penicillium lagena]KAJ5619182.1 hypothetical protein N7510_003166 [Penicillium lagena]